MIGARRDDPGVHQALALQRLTIAWNALEIFVTIGLGVAARSLALVAFGLDSMIEIFAGIVVIWELRGDEQPERTRRALRLVGVAFAALSLSLSFGAVRQLVARAEPSESPLGIAYLAATVVVMLLLARRKATVGEQLGSAPLLAEARITILDAALAASILAALALNVAFAWWWADALATLLVAGWCVAEARESLAEARAVPD